LRECKAFGIFDILFNMKNQEIAKIFHEISDILEIQGANPFRIRAYRRAAQTIDGLAGDIAKMQEDEIKEVPGIGKDLTDKISLKCCLYPVLDQKR
jgi:DNA polymerase/3'-5' exonuclease PolX